MGKSRNPATVTLKMVADQARVSTSAVSYVLRGKAHEMRIGDECASRILSAAKDLGYLGNYHARSLVEGRSWTVGLTANQGAFSLFFKQYWQLIAGGVEIETRERGFDLLLVGGARSKNNLQHASEYLAAKRIDAIIILRQLFDVIPPSLLQRGLPVVMIQSFDHPKISHINLDPAPGLIDAAKYLAGLGHRDVLWLGIDIDSRSSKERVHIFSTAANALGMRVRTSYIEEPQSRGLESEPSRLIMLRQAIIAQLILPEMTTAVMCENDELAIALLQALSHARIRVPQEVSVIGFDDVYGTMATTPSLTTISHRLADMGNAAVRLAIDIIEGRAKPGASSQGLPSEFIIRESTAAPLSSRLRP